jgi:hypothetical protein
VETKTSDTLALSQGIMALPSGSAARLARENKSLLLSGSGPGGLAIQDYN